MSHVVRKLAMAVIAAATGAALFAAAPQAHPGHDPEELGHGGRAELSPEVRRELRKARRATRAFREVAVARAAGYRRTGECTDDPKYGGMGVHYENVELVADGVLDVERPEVLVYQRAATGKLELGAVEYFQADVDQDLATDPDRPELFGVPFDGPMLGHSPVMPVHYDLHVWLYRGNPAGLFAMWNPRVSC